jgi:phosphodiesterase/alkaline phosphatase D-like protein
MKKFFLLFFLSLIHGKIFSTNEVIYLWSGGVTPHSFNVNAKLTDTSSFVRLVASTSNQFINPVYSTFYTSDTTTNKMVAMNISGLTENTKYYYAVESDGILDSSSDDIGTVTTFVSGFCSFYFATGSCCFNSDHVVYDLIRNIHPLFFSCTGDLHYGNPNSATDINVHRNCYENLVLSKPRAAALLRDVPIEYVWDDHDFSGNDSDSTFAGKKNARLAYREYVPHYPLPAGTGNNAIYQTWTVGRVHFIHTDCRSDRYGYSMLGEIQKLWFKNECLLARNNHEIICWLSSTTWSGSTTDNWGGFTNERTELSNFFRDSLIENMFIICGDAHMLAIDDGSNGDFSTGNSNPFRYPVFAAAALNQGGSYKGGTFSEGGVFMNPSVYHGQFGIVSVIDSGSSSICIKFIGVRTDSSEDLVSIVDQYEFCRDLGSDPNHINEFQDYSGSVSVFPNPNTGKFILQTEMEMKNPQVDVMDISGRICKTDFQLSSDKKIIYFNFAPDMQGIYFVRIISGNKILQKKIVICR